MRDLKFGFTLAEVMITLGVIGVVAAITMPQLIANINERTYSKRHQNVVQKVTQAMEQMRALDKLNGTYATTDDFVDALSQHLKIAKRCDSSHITECWTTDKVTDINGDEVLINKVKKGVNLNLATVSDNVGLVLADGASLILNYNPESETLDIGSKVMADEYTTSTTNSIDFVVDVNGSKGPNKEGKDIRNLRTASFTRCTKVGGYCVKWLGYSYECDTTTTYATSSGEADCWQGAINACNALQNMHLPDLDELLTVLPLAFAQGISAGGHHWSTKEDTDTTKAWQKHASSNNPGAARKGMKLFPLCVSN